MCECRTGGCHTLFPVGGCRSTQARRIPRAVIYRHMERGRGTGEPTACTIVLLFQQGSKKLPCIFRLVPTPTATARASADNWHCPGHPTVSPASACLKPLATDHRPLLKRRSDLTSGSQPVVFSLNRSSDRFLAETFSAGRRIYNRGNTIEAMRCQRCWRPATCEKPINAPTAPP